MSDKVMKESPYAKVEIGGRCLEIVKLDWRDAEGHSYDVHDGKTGDLLTMDESYDAPPTVEELRILIEKN